MNTTFSTVPPWVLVVLGALAVLQITLDVIALVDLGRRPVQQVVLGNKWIWVAIILLVSTFGPIIYLLAGRRPALLPDHGPTAQGPPVADGGDRHGGRRPVRAAPRQ